MAQYRASPKRSLDPDIPVFIQYDDDEENLLESTIGAIQQSTTLRNQLEDLPEEVEKVERLQRRRQRNAELAPSKPEAPVSPSETAKLRVPAEGVEDARETLEVILAYLADYEANGKTQPPETADAWERPYVAVNENDPASMDRLYNLILAADYLGIPPLLDLTSSKIADIVMAHSIPELRVIFELPAERGAAGEGENLEEEVGGEGAAAAASSAQRRAPSPSRSASAAGAAAQRRAPSPSRASQSRSPTRGAFV